MGKKKRRFIAAAGIMALVITGCGKGADREQEATDILAGVDIKGSAEGSQNGEAGGAGMESGGWAGSSGAYGNGNTGQAGTRDRSSGSRLISRWRRPMRRFCLPVRHFMDYLTAAAEHGWTASGRTALPWRERFLCRTLPCSPE